MTVSTVNSKTVLKTVKRKRVTASETVLQFSNSKTASEGLSCRKEILLIPYLNYLV